MGGKDSNQCRQKDHHILQVHCDHPCYKQSVQMDERFSSHHCRWKDPHLVELGHDQLCYSTKCSD